MTTQFTFSDTFSEAKRAYIDEEFSSLAKDIAFCNYGSFGVVPKSVLAEQFKYMMEVEADPDRWMRSTSMRLWLDSRKAVAPYFGTDPTNLAFVTNTTSAVNAVLSSIPWKKGDVIIITDWTFSSIKSVCEDLVARHSGDVELYKVQFPYQIKDDKALVDAFMTGVDHICDTGRNPRLCIVDAVTSTPALRFPYEEITKRMSERGIEVCVDAAHAPGQVEINLDTLGADYYAGNLHKWFFCPKGTAIIYVNPKHHNTIRAPVVSMSGCALSKGCALEDFLATHFFWQGTSNNTSFACVTKAIEFFESVGGLAPITEYNRNLSDVAMKLVLNRCKGTMPIRACNSVLSPFMLNFLATPNNPTPHAADYIQADLYRNYRVWVGAGRFRYAGEQLHSEYTVLFRLSAQICNKLSDYERLAEAVNHFIIKGPDALRNSNVNN